MAAQKKEAAAAAAAGMSPKIPPLDVMSVDPSIASQPNAAVGQTAALDEVLVTHAVSSR
jgi:hypothetical protein